MMRVGIAADHGAPMHRVQERGAQCRLNQGGIMRAANRSRPSLIAAKCDTGLEATCCPDQKRTDDHSVRGETAERANWSLTPF
jgi:hypothetical protein